MNFIAPFSQRQTEYAAKTKKSWFNVAEGGKRGSKNVLQTFIFCNALEEHPDKIHLVAGVSAATARLNILDCNGYGLLNYFEGRNRPGKYEGRECVYVQTKTGEKIILVSGGGKDGDEKLIKGNTYGMVYITEANECHRKFINEAFDRTISSTDRKVFHDLNPKNPDHFYYTEVLAYHEEMQKNDSNYGYNYGHFTIADNMSLSTEKIKSILKTYRKGSVWYERDIKGKRIVSEGIIFRYFVENPEPYLIDDSEIWDERGQLKIKFSKFVIGMDFGGTGSKTTMALNGYINGYKNFILLEEAGLPLTDDIGAKEICNLFVDNYRAWSRKYGRIDWTFPDSASPTLINSIIAAAKQAGLPANHIVGCRKNEVKDRPRLFDILLNSGRLKIRRGCTEIQKAIGLLRWDEKKPDIPEDKNIGNCNDWWDAVNYTMLDFIEYIELNR